MKKNSRIAPSRRIYVVISGEPCKGAVLKKKMTYLNVSSTILNHTSGQGENVQFLKRYFLVQLSQSLPLKIKTLGLTFWLKS